MYNRTFNFRQKFVITLSVILFSISVGLQLSNYQKSLEPYTINYEYVNIKDMTQPHIATKVSNKSTVEEMWENLQDTLGNVEEVITGSKPEEVSLPTTKNAASNAAPKRIWYLPVQNGSVTQYPKYGHAAYDITSWRGSAETIFPVANGVISGIYTDLNGALIVTVLHNINGVKYTSQYVHLSSYAPGIYVGKPVTINDALGQMGTTGYSTGIHLHIAVLDCALFDSNDPNCYDLNAWYRYSNKRVQENFYGLGVLTYVPPSWNSR